MGTCHSHTDTLARPAAALRENVDQHCLSDITESHSRMNKNRVAVHDMDAGCLRGDCAKMLFSVTQFTFTEA
jgi:hypothetical protein